MGRKKKSKSKKNTERSLKVIKIREVLCVNVQTCKWTSTCPTLGQRCCNSSSKCCARCADGIVCPIRGIDRN